MSDEIEIHSLSAIKHLLEHRPDRVRMLFLPPGDRTGRLGEIEALARRAGVRVDRSPAARGAEPVRALLPAFRYTEFSDLREKLAGRADACILALDHLQDPQNFGALCRTADGLGAAGILVPRDRGVRVGPGVYHASVGAVETLAIAVVGNLAEALRKLKDDGFWILGASLEAGAVPPWECTGFAKSAVVLGAEGEGLAPGLAKACDVLVRLPIRGKVESYNVSVAGGMILYELLGRPRPTPQRSS